MAGWQEALQLWVAASHLLHPTQLDGMAQSWRSAGRWAGLGLGLAAARAMPWHACMWRGMVQTPPRASHPYAWSGVARTACACSRCSWACTALHLEVCSRQAAGGRRQPSMVMVSS